MIHKPDYQNSIVCTTESTILCMCFRTTNDYNFVVETHRLNSLKIYEKKVNLWFLCEPLEDI